MRYPLTLLVCKDPLKLQLPVISSSQKYIYTHTHTNADGAINVSVGVEKCVVSEK